MFDNLSERLERSFKILKGEGKITEINVAETLKDVRKALLDADVNYKSGKEFHWYGERESAWSERAYGSETEPVDGEDCARRTYSVNGRRDSEINIDSRPAVILMSGLQGSGKTTFSGKIGTNAEK